MNTETELAVVDISDARDGSDATKRAIAARLRDVSTSLGFLYVTGAAIDAEIVARAFARSAEFFALDTTRKAALARGARIDGGTACGYTGPGREHEDAGTPSDLKEAFDLFSARGYIGDAYPGSRETLALETDLYFLVSELQSFAARCAQVADEILRLFALGFDLPAEYFVARHGDNSTLRLLHYPPIAERPLAGQMRVGAHTDFGTCTLLFMDATGGLEIQSPQSRWLPAPSIPDAILVNIGDLMQRWTNGTFRSTPHRVDIPSDGRAQRSRYSIAFFCEPNDDVDIARLPSLDDGAAPGFAPVRAGDYLRARLNTTLVGGE